MLKSRGGRGEDRSGAQSAPQREKERCAIGARSAARTAKGALRRAPRGCLAAWKLQRPGWSAAPLLRAGCGDRPWRIARALHRRR